MTLPKTIDDHSTTAEWVTPLTEFVVLKIGSRETRVLKELDVNLKRANKLLRGQVEINDSFTGATDELETA